MANKGFYQLIGRSDNTKQDVSLGSILRIAAEDINRFETDDPDHPYFKAYVSVVLQPVPEKSSPDVMKVLERLSALTPSRERMKKRLFSEADLRDRAIETAVSESIKAGKIPKKIYDLYARDNEPLPAKFYTDYHEGRAWAQTHIRGLEQDEVEAYKAGKASLADLLEGHSVHIDLRIDFGLKTLIQYVILDNDVESYLRYLRGDLRETAGGKNVQHSMMVVKPSAEEPEKRPGLRKDEKEPSISAVGAKKLADMQIKTRSYFIPAGEVGATAYKPSWMGLIWIGTAKSGVQRMDYHELFLYPDGMLPNENRKLFDGRFVFKCLKRSGGTARWETWKAVSNPKPADPIEHKDGGYFYPVKAEEVKAFGRANYKYGEKRPTG